MTHMGILQPGLRGGGFRPSDVSGPARCSVFVAHRRHLQERHRDLLDNLETERCRRYRIAADRDRFTLAAVLLRAVTGRTTGVEASAVVVDRTCDSCGDPHGRPRLPGTDLEVSISHSGDVVAAAITPAGPVGVDIEQLGSGHTDLVTTVCTGSELRHVGTAADFYAYWTRKEAVLKATGEGLRRRMTSIEVTAPGARPALISLDSGAALACRMADLRIAGYAGAVAVLTAAHVSFDVFDATWLLQASPGSVRAETTTSGTSDAGSAFQKTSAS
jgi:4'-phosphopantetheinyl transferase